MKPEIRERPVFVCSLPGNSPYEEEQSQGFNKKTLCSFTKLS